MRYSKMTEKKPTVGRIIQTFGVVTLLGSMVCFAQDAATLYPKYSVQDMQYVFNRPPLASKPYAELPLGAISARGWLQDELLRMAKGMSGNLDLWYPEVCGSRNAWLGGDGDAWERGPYWIDGLYPLAYLLNDASLIKKADAWVEWTLTHQREDGYIGPVQLGPENRKQPPPPGAQVDQPDDWWPRMVMLKVLQQRYQATGDQRVIDVMTRYFRFQLKTLPDAPLQAPPGGKGGSWWARQRGGENLMSVLWLYNITGQPWLLDLADLLYRKTIPWTQVFLERTALAQRCDLPANPDPVPLLHCVNIAMALKTPLVRFQQDQDPRHLTAIETALKDLDVFHGLPNGLYGADELLHGPGLDRGSELCTAVEMMFSLEKMVEIVGNTAWADRLERIAFNALPTQVSDDHFCRQYFQQTNQIMITEGQRGFNDDGGLRLVYGLLTGYPCCTCNYHQGWPKFVQHLWMASADGGLAAMIYGPSQVTARVGSGIEATITEDTVYPFEETIRFTLKTPQEVNFPVHLRIPGWCEKARIEINGQVISESQGGRIEILNRAWKTGDQIVLFLPMRIHCSYWHERSAVIERGPLVYALRIEEVWSEQKKSPPQTVPNNAMHRGYRECRPAGDWNFALLKQTLDNLDKIEVRTSKEIADNPWTVSNAPVELHVPAVRLPDWILYRNSAGPAPRSPVQLPVNTSVQTIRLIPYGCTTLRICGFPWGSLPANSAF